MSLEKANFRYADTCDRCKYVKELRGMCSYDIDYECSLFNIDVFDFTTCDKFRRKENGSKKSRRTNR